MRHDRCEDVADDLFAEDGTEEFAVVLLADGTVSCIDLLEDDLAGAVMGAVVDPDDLARRTSIFLTR